MTKATKNTKAAKAADADFLDIPVDEELVEAASRARAPRETEERTKRRRRTAMDGATQLNLVPQSELDNTKYSYRWMNATPSRVQQLTVADDYDVVPNEEEKIVGVDRSGQPLAALLVRKRKDWYADDQKKNAEARARNMAGIRKGKTPQGGKNPNGQALSDGGYVPREGIQLKQRGYSA